MFKAVPLIARMTAGVSNLKNFVLKQRELMMEEASSGSPGSLPEARVSKFSNAGSLKMGFTSNMKIPEGTK